MKGDNGLTSTLLQAVASFRTRRPLEPPHKALILQPCCLSRVMLTTPLLAALSTAFPEARFDWAISDWALQAISSNPRVTRVIRSGPGDPAHDSRDEARVFLERLRGEGYDTCFIPSRSEELVRLARQADIPQRVGLGEGRRGFSHSPSVRPPLGERHMARNFLSLAAAVGVDEAILRTAEMEFYPTDSDRTTVARWLVEDLDWLGDAPLVLLHPGGGDNPSQKHLDKRWPAHRFARLGNHLSRRYHARIVVAGTAAERPLAEDVAGMMSFPVANRAGRMGLGELGALCELASLYVGNDAGSTYVAAATGCPTLAIYGPTDPEVYGPHMFNGHVRTLWRAYEEPFDWGKGVPLEEATGAADELFAAHMMADSG